MQDELKFLSALSQKVRNLDISMEPIEFQSTKISLLKLINGRLESLDVHQTRQNRTNVPGRKETVVYRLLPGEAAAGVRSGGPERK